MTTTDPGGRPETEQSAFEPQIVTSTDVEFSPTLSEIAKALIRAQSSMDEVFKDSTNPHFRSKYAGLPACINATKPALLANGIALIQPSTSSPDASVVFVTTMFLHESGEWMRCKLGLQPAKEDPQGAGSAITYGRRYTLLGMCGVAPEDDDDGNAASRPARAPRQQHRANPAPAPANAPQAAERPATDDSESLLGASKERTEALGVVARGWAALGLTTADEYAARVAQVADPSTPWDELSLLSLQRLGKVLAREYRERGVTPTPRLPEPIPPEPEQCIECTGLDGEHLDDDLGPCVNDTSERALRIRAGESERAIADDRQQEIPL